MATTPNKPLPPPPRRGRPTPPPPGASYIRQPAPTPPGGREELYAAPKSPREAPSKSLPPVPQKRPPAPPPKTARQPAAEQGYSSASPRPTPSSPTVPEHSPRSEGGGGEGGGGGGIFTSTGGVKRKKLAKISKKTFGGAKQFARGHKKKPSTSNEMAFSSTFAQQYQQYAAADCKVDPAVTLSHSTGQDTPKKGSNSRRGLSKTHDSPANERGHEDSVPASLEAALADMPKGAVGQPYYAFVSLTNLLFDAIGFDSREREDLEQALLSTRRMKKLSEGEQLCNPRSVRRLRSMKKVVDEFKAGQHLQQAAVTVQSAYRRLQAKRRTDWIRHSFNAEKITAFHELMHRERSYVMNLATVVSQYIMPLQQSQNKHLRDITPEIKVIFGNIEAILNVHKNLMDALKHEAYVNWPLLSGLGQVFTDFAPYFRVYGSFVNNFKLARDTLFECMGRNEAFTQFLDQKTMELSTDLNMLLSLPLNHISGYELMLKRISDATPADDPSVTSLLAAVSISSETSNFIANSLAKAENIAQLHRVKKSIVDSQVELDRLLAADSNLSFSNDTTVEVLQPKKNLPGLLVELSTHALLAKAATAKGPFKLLCSYPLESTKVQDEPTNPLAVTLYVANEEKSDYEDAEEGTKFTLLLPTPDKAARLCKDLQAAVAKNQQNKMFGVPLDVLVEREHAQDHIPRIVKDLVQYLRKHGLECTGLFRIPGTARIVKKLRSAYNQVYTHNAEFPDLETYPDVKPQDVAGVLKMFFHDLPDALCTCAFFDRILENQTQYDPVEDEGYIVEDLRQIVRSLPVTNFLVLEFLMDFFRDVAAKQSVNMMSSANLAMCFGPNIISPAEHTIETTLSIPKTNQAITKMIDYFDYMFLET